MRVGTAGSIALVAADGDEDRNGRRNFDEIKLWTEYLDRVGGDPALYDDNGRLGGYDSDEPFIIVGDLNARPGAEEPAFDGISAVDQLLSHPRLQDTGGFATSGGGLLGRGAGPPEYAERSTAAFLGGARVDYVLPSTGLRIIGGGVYWPDSQDDPAGAERASDHHLVWMQLEIDGGG